MNININSKYDQKIFEGKITEERVNEIIAQLIEINPNALINMNLANKPLGTIFNVKNSVRVWSVHYLYMMEKKKLANYLAKPVSSNKLMANSKNPLFSRVSHRHIKF
ncbi:hypothetical protein CBG25_05165 [Arsenophonus sp. ENCA]|nr:hypothetical protein CBG25_05165 [Arsenophonus sp. ENCA]